MIFILEERISCRSEENVSENLTVSITSSRLDYPACGGRNLTLTCSIFGESLTWYLNGILLNSYFESNAECGVYERQVISGQPDTFITYSVLATKVNMGSGFFNCTSILTVTSTANTMIDTITCASSNLNNENPLGDRYCNYSYNVLIGKRLANIINLLCRALPTR